MRRDPEFFSAEDLLGIEYVHLGRLEEAEKAFRRTIVPEPAWWMKHESDGENYRGSSASPGGHATTLSTAAAI